MKTCNYCGKQLPDDSSFCQYCGKALATEEKPKIEPTVKKAATKKTAVKKETISLLTEAEKQKLVKIALEKIDSGDDASDEAAFILEVVIEAGIFSKFPSPDNLTKQELAKLEEIIKTLPTLMLEAISGEENNTSSVSPSKVCLNDICFSIIQTLNVLNFNVLKAVFPSTDVEEELIQKSAYSFFIDPQTALISLAKTLNSDLILNFKNDYDGPGIATSSGKKVSDTEMNFINLFSCLYFINNKWKNFVLNYFLKKMNYTDITTFINECAPNSQAKFYLEATNKTPTNDNRRVLEQTFLNTLGATFLELFSNSKTPSLLKRMEIQTQIDADNLVKPLSDALYDLTEITNLVLSLFGYVLESDDITENAPTGNWDKFFEGKNVNNKTLQIYTED